MDSKWVDDELLPQLRRMAVRYAIDHEQFRAAAPVQAELMRLLKESRQTIIVLSKNWLASVWAMFEAQSVRVASGDEFASKFLILRIEDCPNPKLLENVTAIDVFRVRQPVAWSKLRRAIVHERAKAGGRLPINSTLTFRRKYASPNVFGNRASSYEYEVAVAIENRLDFEIRFDCLVVERRNGGRLRQHRPSLVLRGRTTGDSVFEVGAREFAADRRERSSRRRGGAAGEQRISLRAVGNGAAQLQRGREARFPAERLALFRRDRSHQRLLVCASADEPSSAGRECRADHRLRSDARVVAAVVDWHRLHHECVARHGCAVRCRFDLPLGRARHDDDVVVRRLRRNSTVRGMERCEFSSESANRVYYIPVHDPSWIVPKRTREGHVKPEYWLTPNMLLGCIIDAPLAYLIALQSGARTEPEEQYAAKYLVRNRYGGMRFEAEELNGLWRPVWRVPLRLGDRAVAVTADTGELWTVDDEGVIRKEKGLIWNG